MCQNILRQLIPGRPLLASVTWCIALLLGASDIPGQESMPVNESSLRVRQSPGSPAAVPNLMWVRQIGMHANHGPDLAAAAVVDREGNCYVTGTSDGLGSSTDFSTVKFDLNGNVAWSVRYDGPRHGRDEATAIAIDSVGNTYVTGLDNDLDAWLQISTQKINPAGEVEWVRSYRHYGMFFYRSATDLIEVIPDAGSASSLKPGSGSHIHLTLEIDEKIAYIFSADCTTNRVTNSPGILRGSGERNRLKH